MRKAVVRKEMADDTRKFVNEVQQKTGLSESDAEMAVDVLISTIPKALKNADSMELAGLGAFSVKYKKGQESPGSEHYRIVKFNPDGRLKDLASSCRTNV